MEFWTSVRILLRHWYIVVFGLALTVLIGLTLVHGVKPSYKASGTVLLTSSSQLAPSKLSTPPTSTTLPRTNPLAQIDPSQFALLFGEAASSASFKAQMVRAGVTGAFTVSGIPAQQALALSTTGSTPDEAMHSYQTLRTELSDALDEKQQSAGAPEGAYLVLRNWAPPLGATAQSAARVKVIIVVGIVGFLLTLSMAFLTDSVLAALGRRGRERDRVRSAAAPVSDDVDGSQLLDELADLDVAPGEEPSRRPGLTATSLVDRSRFAEHVDDTFELPLAAQRRRSEPRPLRFPEDHPRAAGD